MPRRCTVCDHPETHSIDEALVSGAPYRSVAKRFGLSDSAVYRHKTEHLPARLSKAKEAEEAARARDQGESPRPARRRERRRDRPRGALRWRRRPSCLPELAIARQADSHPRGETDLFSRLFPECRRRAGHPEWAAGETSLLEERRCGKGAQEPGRPPEDAGRRVAGRERRRAPGEPPGQAAQGHDPRRSRRVDRPPYPGGTRVKFAGDCRSSAWRSGPPLCVVVGLFLINGIILGGLGYYFGLQSANRAGQILGIVAVVLSKGPGDPA
jgi:transposase-like protein